MSIIIPVTRRISAPNGGPKDYGTGRKCTECSAPLNRYNPGPGCHLHAQAPEEEVKTKVCPECQQSLPRADFQDKRGTMRKMCKHCRTNFRRWKRLQATRAKAAEQADSPQTAGAAVAGPGVGQPLAARPPGAEDSR